MLDGRDHVIPEDIQAILASVAGHRLVSNSSLTSSEDNIIQLLKSVPV